MSISGIDFFTIGSSDKNILSYSVSLPANSRETSSTSIVDLVIKVCFEDLHETAAPLSVNTYPLVAFISSDLRSSLHHYALQLQLDI